MEGCALNDPASGPCSGWSAEVKFPLAGLAINNSAGSEAPRPGGYWRINFSRVQWKVHTEGARYALGAEPGGDNGACPWPCPVGTAANKGDNWVWAPTGVVDVHQPERWGYIQFASGAVNGTSVRTDPDWAVRTVAMQLYQAQAHLRATAGAYTENVTALGEAAALGPQALDGSCTGLPVNAQRDSPHAWRGLFTAVPLLSTPPASRVARRTCGHRIDAPCLCDRRSSCGLLRANRLHLSSRSFSSGLVGCCAAGGGGGRGRRWVHRAGAFGRRPKGSVCDGALFVSLVSLSFSLSRSRFSLALLRFSPVLDTTWRAGVDHFDSCVPR